METRGTGTVVCGKTDRDAGIEFEIVIEDGGGLASAYRAVDFTSD